MTTRSSRNRSRPAVLVGWAVIALVLPTVRARGDDTLETLWKDYQAYGLPAPPAGATLAHLPGPGVSVYNGVRHQDIYLVLVVKPAEGKNSPVYWLGCEPGPTWDSITFQPVPPKLDSLKGTVPLSMEELGSRPQQFPVYPDLALAIHCHACGWTDIAEALLARSREKAKGRRDTQVPPRPRDDRAAVALLAWNHYCNRFARTKGDRKPIVEQMKKLLAGPHGLDTRANRNIVADMEQTLVEVKTAHGSPEAALEGLLEFDTDWGSWLGSGWRDVRNNADGDKNYKALRDLGIAAAPLLIRHRDDFRLTRHLEETSNRGYAWHLRVADVVAQLLNGLADQPFAYDFLEAEGRGIRLDVAHVAAWWKEAGGAKELDYLLQHVERKDEDGRATGNAPVLQSLGSRYPNELVKLFEARQKTGQVDGNWFEALLSSKAPAADKARLFLAAADSKDEWQQINALRALSDMKHRDTGRLLIAALDRQPRTPAGEYWHSNIGNFAQIAIGLKDDAVWEAMLKTAKRVDVGQRLEMLQAFGRCTLGEGDRREIRFLQALLSDAEERGKRDAKFDGPSAGFMYDRITVRDFAALQLAHVFRLKAGPDFNWKEVDWTKLREKVEARLTEWEKSPASKGDKKP